MKGGTKCAVTKPPRSHRTSRSRLSVRMSLQSRGQLCPKTSRKTTATTATKPSNTSWVRGDHRNAEARMYREKGRALARQCSQPQEGREEGNGHPSRALRGVLTGLHRSRQRQRARGLHHEWTDVHPFARGKLEREHRQRVLRWPADELRFHAGLWGCIP